MKAHVKVNIQIHVESEASAAGTDAKDALKAKYPISAQYAGVTEISSLEEGERAMAMFKNKVDTMFRDMSVQPAVVGPKAEFTAAFGGMPEPEHAARIAADLAAKKEGGN